MPILLMVAFPGCNGRAGWSAIHEILLNGKQFVHIYVCLYKHIWSLEVKFLFKMGCSSNEFSISFCTTCRNRLEHLKLTLPENLEACSNLPNIKFVLLDYTSEDGLGEWIRKNYSHHLASGKLEYYRTENATFFHRTHSRNLAFKVASTDVICNVDADNYIGEGFAEFIAEQFSLASDIFLTTIDFYKTQKNHVVQGDVLGRVCVKKDHFLAVRGFDERMEQYGFEDYDLTNRLEMSGLKRTFITNQGHLRYLSHENDLRFSTLTFSGDPGTVYIRYDSGYKSSILFLYKDGTFSGVTMINNIRLNAADVASAYTERNYPFENSFENNLWQHGNWSRKRNAVYLEGRSGAVRVPISNRIIFRENDNMVYHRVSDPNLLQALFKLRITSTNRILLEENLRNGPEKVNIRGFGSGWVIKNFNETMFVQ